VSTAAPPDAEANAAYDTIMDLARRHALISYACGGIAVISTPGAQREAGERKRILDMHEMVEP
jgi:hypothetical protein